MLPSIPAAFALLLGAVLGALAQGHAGTPITPADVRDASYGLSISASVDQEVEGAGGPLTYRIVVDNTGPSAFSDATVLDDVPEALTDVRWSCAAGGGAVCRAASGSGGNVAAAVALPPGGSVTVVVEGTVAGEAAGGTIVDRASFHARMRSLLAGDLILRSDPVTTTVPEEGHELDWTD